MDPRRGCGEGKVMGVMGGAWGVGGVMESLG